jgi:hypothetical protein
LPTRADTGTCFGTGITSKSAALSNSMKHFTQQSGTEILFIGTGDGFNPDLKALFFLCHPQLVTIIPVPVLVSFYSIIGTGTGFNTGFNPALKALFFLCQPRFIIAIPNRYRFIFISSSVPVPVSSSILTFGIKPRVCSISDYRVCVLTKTCYNFLYCLAMSQDTDSKQAPLEDYVDSEEEEKDEEDLPKDKEEEEELLRDDDEDEGRMEVEEPDATGTGPGAGSGSATNVLDTPPSEQQQQPPPPPPPSTVNSNVASMPPPHSAPPPATSPSAAFAATPPRSRVYSNPGSNEKSPPSLSQIP